MAHDVTCTYIVPAHLMFRDPSSIYPTGQCVYPMSLSNVAIHIPLLPLHIILLDQPINILLDITNPQHTPTHRRLDDLSHQLLMADRLTALHDSDDSGLTLEVPILGDTDVRLLVLLLGLLELDLVDLDTVLGVREVAVDGECVGRIDLFAFRVLCQWAEFGAGERLEGSFDLWFSWKKCQMSIFSRVRREGLRRPVSLRMCWYVRWSFSVKPLNKIKTIAWKLDTTNSLTPLLNVARI